MPTSSNLKKSIIDHLGELWNRESKNIGSVIGLGIAMNMLLLAVPVAVQVLVNHYSWAVYQEPTILIILALTVVLIAASVMRLVQSKLVERFQRRIFCDTAFRFSSRLSFMQLDAKVSTRPAELVNRFFETISLQKASVALLLDGVSLLLQTIFGVILISLYHPFLFAFALALSASIYTVLFISGRGAYEAASDESVKKYETIAWIEEIAACPHLFRSNYARDHATQTTLSLLTNYIQAREQTFQLLHKKNIGLSIIQVVASIALLTLGGIMVVTKNLSLGELVAAEIIVTSVLLNIVKFHKHIENFLMVAVAQSKIHYATDLPQEISGKAEVNKTEQDYWRFEKVRLDRFVETNPQFHEIQLGFEAGGRYSILSPNGTGKSTLFRLMVGTLQPDRGVIVFNGIDIRQLNLSQLRDRVALVKETEILPGTIAENLRVGRDWISLEDITKALESVDLSRSILNLEHGLDSTLKSDGSPLSSAEKRKLMVARAILGKPSTLILDGVFDSLDLGVATKILGKLSAPEHAWTLIVGTSNQKIADQLQHRILWGNPS